MFLNLMFFLKKNGFKKKFVANDPLVKTQIYEIVHLKYGLKYFQAPCS